MSCPASSDGEHWWQLWDPPEWMDTSEWDDDAWQAYNDNAGATCYRCGEVEDPT